MKSFKNVLARPLTLKGYTLRSFDLHLCSLGDMDQMLRCHWKLLGLCQTFKPTVQKVKKKERANGDCKSLSLTHRRTVRVPMLNKGSHPAKQVVKSLWLVITVKRIFCPHVVLYLLASCTTAIMSVVAINFWLFSCGFIVQCSFQRKGQMKVYRAVMVTPYGNIPYPFWRVGMHKWAFRIRSHV